MTMAYQVKSEYLEKLIGVINIDGSCRPQIVTNHKSKFGKLLLEMKKHTGIGVLLNTSFNIHGDPLVCTPEDAVNTFIETGIKYLVMNNYLVEA